MLDYLSLYIYANMTLHSRANSRLILKYLREAWAKDRRAEWSIWMVYSKVEMPHHYLNSGFDEPPYNGVHRKVSSLLKLNDDVNTDTLHFSLPTCLVTCIKHLWLNLEFSFVLSSLLSLQQCVQNFTVEVLHK